MDDREGRIKQAYDVVVVDHFGGSLLELQIGVTRLRIVCADSDSAQVEWPRARGARVVPRFPHVTA
jgi:hypothetical protein